MNIDAPLSNFITLPGMHRPDPNSPKRELRLPGIGFLPNKVRNHFIAMMGEFIGTFLFLFFAFCGTQVANAGAGPTTGGSLSQAPNVGTLLYISLAFGFSLAVNAWVFFRISGGLFNPAVTLALALIGAVGWVRAGLVFIAQILGAMSAAAVVSAILPGSLNVSTTLGGGASIAQGVFLEMFLTAELVFTIIMLAAEKHKGTFMAPIGIGLSLFIAELTGVYFTGGSLNPARSFGPCVVIKEFPHYHWIYWIGPMLGSLVAVGFYRLIKALEYETANPGQDFNDKEAEVFQFDEENAATGADVARPTVAIGQPDYVADDLGVRPASSLDAERNLSGDGSRMSKTRSKAYSSGSGGRPSNSAGNDNAFRNSAGNDNAYRNSTGNDNAYRNASNVENGELGGTYRVSGLRDLPSLSP